MWVVYSANESRLQDEDMYWNNELGWVDLESATQFATPEFYAPTTGEWVEK